MLDDEDNIKDDEQDNHMPDVTMKELISTIDSLKNGNRQTAKESKREISKELTKKRQNSLSRLGFRKDPDDGSSDDVQTCCPRKQRMEN